MHPSRRQLEFSKSCIASSAPHHLHCISGIIPKVCRPGNSPLCFCYFTPPLSISPLCPFDADVVATLLSTSFGPWRITLSSRWWSCWSCAQSSQEVSSGDNPFHCTSTSYEPSPSGDDNPILLTGKWVADHWESVPEVEQLCLKLGHHGKALRENNGTLDEYGLYQVASNDLQLCQHDQWLKKVHRNV